MECLQLIYYQFVTQMYAQYIKSIYTTQRRSGRYHEKKIEKALDGLPAGGGILETRPDGRIIGQKTNGVIGMSDYPDWVEDRFGGDIPDWAEDRWGDDDGDDDDD